MLTLMYFERKLNFIETHKNTYTGSFSIIDPEYGGSRQRNIEFRSAFAANCQFLTKPKANTYGF
jgi:hypothetical protein